MSWDNTESKELFKTITYLKSESEARRFFRDLLTEQEIIEFGNRWKAAKMLNSKTPYSKICEQTGLSSRTVARISKWLKGGMGGYRNAIKTQKWKTTKKFKLA